MAEQNEKDSIEKLLSVITRQNSLLGSTPEKHDDDSLELKRQFFLQLTSNIERTSHELDALAKALSSLQKEFHAYQLTLKNELSVLKDLINSEAKTLKKDHDADMDKISEKLEKYITKLSERLEVLSQAFSGFKENSARDSSSFKDKLMTDEIKPLTDKVTNIYIKVMVLSTVAGIVASTILSIFMTFIKN